MDSAWNSLASECLALTSTDEPDEAELSRIESLLAAQLEFRALLLSQVRPDWTSSSERPGVLIRATELGDVHVPVHLGVDFPEGDPLDGLVWAGGKVRTSDGSTLCLAGSCTHLGALQYVGDVDYCEYLDDTNVASLHGASQGWKEEREAPCRRAKLPFGSPEFVEFERPWDDAENLAPWENPEFAQHCEKEASAKLDFVTDLPGLGVVEVTNVVLGLSEQEGGHVAQEAVINSTDIRPDEISDPIAFSRYVRWLQGECAAYLLSERPLKAAKRMLSLARVTFSKAEGNSLLAYLSGPEGAEAALLASHDLLAKIDRGVATADETLGDFRDRLTRKIAALEAEASQSDVRDPASLTQELLPIYDALSERLNGNDG